ncbi:unnamed protein product [Camellia sinensis]
MAAIVMSLQRRQCPLTRRRKFVLHLKHNIRRHQIWKQKKQRTQHHQASSSEIHHCSIVSHIYNYKYTYKSESESKIDLGFCYFFQFIYGFGKEWVSGRGGD